MTDRTRPSNIVKAKLMASAPRKWHVSPETPQEWICLYYLEHMPCFQMDGFFRWLAVRSGSEDLVAEVSSIIGEIQPKFRSPLLALVRKYQAKVRVDAAQEQGKDTALATSQMTKAQTEYQKDMSNAQLVAKEMP